MTKLDDHEFLIGELLVIALERELAALAKQIKKEARR